MGSIMESKQTCSVVRMSARAFGSKRPQLEVDTVCFCAPLNQRRQFLLLRLDSIPSKTSRHKRANFTL